MPDVAIPDPLTYIIIAGAVALALFNLGRLARLLRIPQTARRIVSWLATIARDAFIQGAQEGLRQFVRQELYPNGGVNIRDAVDRTERMVRETGERLDNHIEWTVKLADRNNLDPPDVLDEDD